MTFSLIRFGIVLIINILLTEISILCVCVCVCVYVCACVSVRACVRACVHAIDRMSVCEVWKVRVEVYVSHVAYA